MLTNGEVANIWQTSRMKHVKGLGPKQELPTYQAAAHTTCRLCLVKLTASTSVQLGTRFPALYVLHVVGYAYCCDMNCRNKYRKRSAYFQLPLSTRI
jgi:hypothetical protein